MDIIAFLQNYLGLAGSILLLYFVVLPFEVLSPAEEGQPWIGRLQNIVYMLGFIFVTALLITPLFNSIYSVYFRYIGGGILPLMVNADSGIVAHMAFGLFYAFVWDVWQYSVHRLQHAVPVLWETHIFHHSERSLNSTSQARTHLTQYVLYLVLFFPMFLIFAGQSPHLIIAFIMFRILGIYNHSNIKISFGRLTPVISGPQWHRIHHSIQIEHQDKNFAAIFPLIDIVGRTYYRPKKDEFPKTGLSDTGHFRFSNEATFLPLVNWYNMSQKVIRSGRKI